MRLGLRIRGLILILTGAMATALAVGVVKAGEAALAAPQLKLMGVDVYGTDQLNPEEIRNEFRADLQAMGAAQASFDLERVRAIQEPIEAALMKRGAFAYLRLSFIEYYQPKGAYLTIDVVEEKDRVRRIPFRQAPTGEFDDPDGLFAAWDKYQKTVFQLANEGRLKSFDSKRCPVLHCIASFDQPELKPYLARFNRGAARHTALLYRIAEEDKNAVHRGDAIFLLAHTNDVAMLMPLLSKEIYDPATVARNNAMRVMALMAAKGIEADYPISDLARALDFPDTSDRNKAAATLTELAKTPSYRGAIRSAAVPTLLKLLRLKQPNNHDWAYAALKEVSGKTFGDRDYDAWENWASRHHGAAN